MFNQFNLNERIQKALAKCSLNQPTEVQTLTIPPAMKGLDLFVTAPTGTGKTLAFLLPLLHNLLTKGQPGAGLQALIILPTRELASQIDKELKTINNYTFFTACLVTGGEDLKQQAAKLRKNPDIIIGTPGRLAEHWKAHQFELKQLQLLVLDETDRILDMDFGDDVKLILNNCPPHKQTLLFSATLGDATLQELAKAHLNAPKEIHLNINNLPNANITQQVILADDTTHKTKLTQWLLASESYQKVIIFTNTRAQADLLSHSLTINTLKHLVLHSDKLAEERKQTLIKLTQQSTSILIATDLAARGLDIQKVDLIINFDLPNNMQEYVHRIGRTGRMDNKGLAISLVTPKDWNKLIKIETTLKYPLIKRLAEHLKGKFQGITTSPQKPQDNPPVKQHKKPITDNKDTTKKPKVNKRPSTLVNADGTAPLKRKKISI